MPTTIPASAPSGQKYCFECGSLISARAEICPECGVRQMAPPSGYSASPSGRSRLVAALLAILLGGLGIHKFYLGKGLQGLLYLVFCWTGIPLIVGVIEGILLLLMSDVAFARKYG